MRYAIIWIEHKPETAKTARTSLECFWLQFWVGIKTYWPTPLHAQRVRTYWMTQPDETLSHMSATEIATLCEVYLRA